ncbi:MAG TPA: hypothetical protein VHG08_02460 [Longimicrobium sp.]|nr:hypothetical protein [Longimicrobium sp.]
MKISRIVSWSVLLLLTGACIDSDGMGSHLCDPVYWDPSDWSRYNLELVHREPRFCPVGISGPGEQVYLAASILDYQNPDFVTSTVRVVAAGWSNLEVGGDLQYFDYDPYGTWVVQHRLYYYAATQQDVSGDPHGDEIRYALGPVAGPDQPTAEVLVQYYWTQ